MSAADASPKNESDNGDANEAIDLEMRDTEVRVVRVLKRDEEGEEIRWRDADDDALTNINGCGVGVNEMGEMLSPTNKQHGLGRRRTWHFPSLLLGVWCFD